MMKKNRGWFQIHLSTAIVLMLSAGALLYLNMRPQTLKYEGIPSSLHRHFTEHTTHGFPLPISTYSKSWAEAPSPVPSSVNEDHVWSWPALTFDFLTAISGLLIVAFISELLTRHWIDAARFAVHHSVPAIVSICAMAVLWLINGHPRTQTLPASKIVVIAHGWPYATKADIAFDDPANQPAFSAMMTSDLMSPGTDELFKEVNTFALQSNKWWNMGAAVVAGIMAAGLTELALFFFRRARQTPT